MSKPVAFLASDVQSFAFTHVAIHGYKATAVVDSSVSDGLVRFTEHEVLMSDLTLHRLRRFLPADHEGELPLVIP